MPGPELLERGRPGLDGGFAHLGSASFVRVPLCETFAPHQAGAVAPYDVTQTLCIPSDCLLGSPLGYAWVHPLRGGSRVEKVLVANRGEIAVRVLRACRELGLVAVAVYSDADRDALHVEVADEAWHIGEAAPAKSYLNVDGLVEVARWPRSTPSTPAGFLAENAAFAQAVLDAGLRWVGQAGRDRGHGRQGVGPPGRRAGQGAAGPGHGGALTDPEAAVAFGDRHGYPLALKAAFGGGGRGMKVVRTADEVAAGLESARRGTQCLRPRRDLRRALPGRSRHVEAQVLADGRGEVVFLGERDCSLQRRHQKLVEEAPAPACPRRCGWRWARRPATSPGRPTQNAGTIEFLYEPTTDRFYFLEMNTWLQVEHPVTELTAGIDLVHAQLRVAAGEGIPAPPTRTSRPAGTPSRCASTPRTLGRVHAGEADRLAGAARGAGRRRRAGSASVRPPGLRPAGQADRLGRGPRPGPAAMLRPWTSSRSRASSPPSCSTAWP